MQLVRARSRQVALVTRTTTALAISVGLGLGVAPALSPASAAVRPGTSVPACHWSPSPGGHAAPGFRCSTRTSQR